MKRISISRLAFVFATLAMSAVLFSCAKKSDPSNPNMNGGTRLDQGDGGSDGDSDIGTTQEEEGSLYDEYGGLAGVQSIVDDTVAADLADPTVAPFFAVIGTPGFDTVDRLKSCLDLQFVALLGGPATYPGVSNYRNAPPEGYACRDMASSHAGLGITNEAFDRFITILSGVLASKGFSEADIAEVAPALLGLRSDIVTGEQKQK